MADVEIAIRAKAIVAEAFLEANKALDQLGDKAEQTGAGAEQSGGRLSSLFGTMGTIFAGAGISVASVAGAIGGLATGIVALGDRGAAVGDLRQSFKDLNAVIGNDSTAVLQTLKTAFMGTRSEAQIMEMANKALTAGVKASKEDFQLLAEGARVLADRTGMDATAAFDELTRAMATGKSKQVELLVGYIDNEQALADYESVIGKSAKSMSEAEKIDATATAVKLKLKEALELSGKAGFDFSDAIEAAKTMVVDFKERLGESIAQSPAVLAALAGIHRAFTAAFGGDQQQQVKALSGHVDTFSLFLMDVASIAIKAAQMIGEGFGALKWVFATVMGAVADVGLAFAEVNAKAAEIMASIPGVGRAFKGSAEQAKDAAIWMRGYRDSFTEQSKEASASASSTTTWGKALAIAQKEIAATRAEMVKASAAAAAFVGPLQENSKGLDAIAKSTKGAITQKEEFQKTLKKTLAEWDALNGKTTTYTSTLGTVTTKLEAIGLDTDKWTEKNVDLTSTLGKIDTKVTALATGPSGLSVLADRFVRLGQASQGSLGAIMGGMGQLVLHLDEAQKTASKTGGQFGLLSETLAKGKTATERWSTALAAGGAVAQGFADVMKATEGETRSFHGAMGGAAAGAKAGAMFGPWGAAIGAVGGALMGLFRAKRQAREELEKFQAASKQAVGDFKALHPSITDLNTAAAALGVTLNFNITEKWHLERFNIQTKQFAEALALVNTEMSTLLTQATDLGIGLPDSLQASIMKMIDLGVLTADTAKIFHGMLWEGQVDWKKMEEAAKRYGIEADTLGERFQQQKLHTSAEQIINDYDLLTRGGADVGTVLAGMADEISELVSRSILFGTSIPENMRPMIEELMKSGQLIGRNGEALTDMSAIQFGDPIVTAFERIVAKLDELIARLTGPVTGAINGLPRDITVNVNGVWNPPEDMGVESEGFASGTLGRSGRFWRDFGAGTLTVLHGREAVITPSQASAFAAQHGGGGSEGARWVAMERTIGALAAAVLTLPAEMTRAQRDAMLQVGSWSR